MSNVRYDRWWMFLTCWSSPVSPRYWLVFVIWSVVLKNAWDNYLWVLDPSWGQHISPQCWNHYIPLRSRIELWCHPLLRTCGQVINALMSVGCEAGCVRDARLPVTERIWSYKYGPCVVVFCTEYHSFSDSKWSFPQLASMMISVRPNITKRQTQTTCDHWRDSDWKDRLLYLHDELVLQQKYLPRQRWVRWVTERLHL